MIRNIFASHIIAGKPGFYVDSGANDAEALSNTLFFDVCLGWTGICVEPNEIYHKELSEKRSCALVPECISDTISEQQFLMQGAGGHVSKVATATSSLVTDRWTTCSESTLMVGLMSTYGPLMWKVMK